jgi:hypothetical protein
MASEVDFLTVPARNALRLEQRFVAHPAKVRTPAPTDWWSDFRTLGTEMHWNRVLLNHGCRLNRYKELPVGLRLREVDEIPSQTSTWFRPERPNEKQIWLTIGSRQFSCVIKARPQLDCGLRAADERPPTVRRFRMQTDSRSFPIKSDRGVASARKNGVQKVTRLCFAE